MIMTKKSYGKKRISRLKKRSFVTRFDAVKDLRFKQEGGWNTLAEIESHHRPLEESLIEIKQYVESGGDLNEAEESLRLLCKKSDGNYRGFRSLLEETYLIIEDIRLSERELQNTNNFLGSRYHDMAESYGY